MGVVDRKAGSHAVRVAAAMLLALLGGTPQLRAASATDVPLLQPTSVAYDASGNLYFAESRNNVIRRLGTDGTLTTVAGSSVQGFAGDSGTASAAELDAPRGVALDAAGNLYISDTHNNRIRRVDAQSHLITTIAGTGVGDFSGDGGSATAAHLREPLALALDGNNHLFIADSGNQRIRSIDLVTNIISTVVGNGRQGFSGEGGPAIDASLDSPSGLVLDALGDLFIADAGNRRVREVSSATRQINTIAGPTGSPVPLRRPEGLSFDSTGGLLISDAASHSVLRLDLVAGTLSVIAGRGIQSFSGDQGSATLALLDTPMGIAISPTTGALAISDSGNARIRLVSPGATPTIATIAGVGSKLAQVLQLSGSPVQPYGSATVSVNAVSTSTVSGTVALYLATPGQPSQTLQATLGNGNAVFDLGGLSAGTYQIYGVSPGDSTHSPATSAITTLQIEPLPVQLLSSAWSTTFGSALPAFSAQLTGVLARDQSSVAVTSVVSAPSGSSTLPPGVYSVASTLTGSAAANYVLSGNTGQLTVAKAPVRITLNPGSSALEIAVASTTSGSPTGALTLLTSAGTTAAAVPLQAGGTATVAFSGLAAGTYLFSAVYSGDADFLPAQSAPVSVTVSTNSQPAALPDFALTSAGASTVSAPSGGSATYSLQIRPTGTALSSPIMLTVTGLPAGATAGFSPNFVPPGTPASVVTLTVQLPQSSARVHGTVPLTHGDPGWAGISLAALVLFGLPAAWRPRYPGWRLLAWGLLLIAPLGLAGCGDRVFPSANGPAPQTYSLVVTGTTTQPNGSAIQHSTTLTLTVP